MIPRYTRPEAAKIWDADNKFDILFEIEILACEAMEKIGLVPHGNADAIKVKRAWKTWDSARIDEIEKTTKHDVIAFLTYISEQIGDEAKYLHLGMTSSDILDTCLSVQLKQSGELILAGIDKILAHLKRLAFQFKDTVCIGRSHGIHAEPTTIGLKFSGFYAEFIRAKHRMIAAIEEISVCAISGPVGTFASVNPSIQKHVANGLKLKEESVSTQVIPRDRHAMFFATLGVIASSIERFAIEVRHSQRTEVLEMEEGFSAGQKGSSAMPHKRNPILSENLTGLARIVRAAVTPAFENVALWHERDISHSSVERMFAPDATVTLDFALHRMAGLLENLQVYPENAMRNLDILRGLAFSQRVLITLIEKAKIAREVAYKIVQETAMKIWRKETDLDFRILLSQNIEVASRLSESEIDEIFDISYYLKHVDCIFSGVFEE